MRIILILLTAGLTGCGSFSRVRFTVGYGEATVGIEADIRDPGKNPIARRAPSGK